MSERSIQNEIRNALAGRCLTFRANVGQAWTGDATRLPNGDMLIKNARPFQTGLPPGFSDLFGIKKHVVTAADVGKPIARFFGLECKTATGKPTEQQKAFLGAVAANGGLSGVVRSVEDAIAVLGLE